MAKKPETPVVVTDEQIIHRLLFNKGLGDRTTYIGASDAKAIMTGNIMDVYLLKVGAKPEEDLSDVLPVQMGSFTEPLNAYWFTKQTGLMIGLRNSFHRCTRKGLEFVAANLDGELLVEGEVIGWEAKHCNAFMTPEKVAESYYWQAQHQMLVRGYGKVTFSVLSDNNKWFTFDIERDEDSITALTGKLGLLWACVSAKNPTPLESVTATITPVVKVDKLRVVHMNTNEWASLATDWLENSEAAKKLKAAEDGIKKLVPEDAKTAAGGGIIVSVSKTGAKTIKAGDVPADAEPLHPSAATAPDQVAEAEEVPEL
jgi:predicted phage-related endonuclease